MIDFEDILIILYQMQSVTVLTGLLIGDPRQKGAGNGCDLVKTEPGNCYVLVKTDRDWK